MARHVGEKGWVDARAGCEIVEMDGQLSENFIAVACGRKTGGHHRKSSGRLSGTTGRWLRSEWRHTGGIHSITSNEYSLQWL